MCGKQVELNTNLKKRNSSIELLRIISIFGIITMHCFGEFYSTCTGTDLAFGVSINTIFNTGVSCFMLISGFYGLEFRLNKLIKIVLIVLFYSYADIIIKFALMHTTPSLSQVLKSFFPLLTGKYWFISCYVVIYLLSDSINKFTEQLTKVKFIELISILLVCFYIAPTALYLQLLNDSGKGIVNLIILYLTGRFIHKYYNYTKKYSTIVIVYLINIIIIYTFSYIISSLNGGGIKYPILLRDNSILIYINSVILFLLFKRQEFYNETINYIASCVMGIYLNEGIIRTVVENTNPKLIFTDRVVIVRVILTSVFVFILSFIVETLRRFLFDICKFDLFVNNIVLFASNIRSCIVNTLENILENH